nr:nascent polypeptide-associated complex subunit alpha, muscle-specific form-like isoform X2 [Microcebus murinus]
MASRHSPGDAALNPSPGPPEHSEFVDKSSFTTNMSTSHFEQRKKPLDMFFWANEVTGEITYPPLKADGPAASPENPRESPRSQRGSMQGAPPSPQGPTATPAQRPAPPPYSEVSTRDTNPRNARPPALTYAKAGLQRPLPFSAIPVTIPSPGGTLPALSPLRPAAQPPASAFSVSPSASWAFTCKLKNVLTGNNRFSF